MIKQYKLAEIAVQDILNRDIREEHDVEAVVDEIMAKVRVDGDAALLEYEQRFDKAQLEALQVSEAEIAEAVASLDADFIRTLELARVLGLFVWSYRRTSVQKLFSLYC